MPGMIYEFEEDGKNYVAVEQGLDVYIRWLTWVATIILFASIIGTGFIFVTHIQELTKDPIQYGMIVNDMDVCTCLNDGTEFTITKSDIIAKQKMDKFDFDLSNLPQYNKEE